jgi:hypothetical protein
VAAYCADRRSICVSEDNRAIPNESADREHYDRDKGIIAVRRTRLPITRPPGRRRRG